MILLSLHEVFDKSVLIAIGLSVLGAAALSIDSSLVVQWLHAPPWLAEVLSWRWPG